MNFSQAVRSLADEASVKELLERARYILMASFHYPRFAHPVDCSASSRLSFY